MKGRTGFVLGVAAGYMLGTKAGRRPTEQTKYSTPPVRSIEPARTMPEATTEPRSKVQQLVGNGLRATSKLLRET